MLLELHALLLLLFEEPFSGAFGLPRLCPEVFEAIADGMEGEGQEVHGGEQHGEVLLAVAEIVFELVALVLQRVERLVLDLPAAAPGLDDLDAALRDEVVGRVDHLGLPSYTGFVMPKLDARTGADGTITDVVISYPKDLKTQMLEYSAATRALR